MWIHPGEKSQAESDMRAIINVCWNTLRIPTWRDFTFLQPKFFSQKHKDASFWRSVFIKVLRKKIEFLISAEYISKNSNNILTYQTREQRATQVQVEMKIQKKIVDNDIGLTNWCEMLDYMS